MGLKFESHLAIILVASMAIAVPTGVGVTVTPDTVTAYGMDSCGGYYHTGGTFENYCPFCKHSGTLTYNPKGTVEGEWTCKHCDADFCNCGRCKAGGSGVYLIKTSPSVTIEPKKTPQAPAPEVPVVSGLQKVINCLQSNKTVLGAT